MKVLSFNVSEEEIFVNIGNLLNSKYELSTVIKRSEFELFLMVNGKLEYDFIQKGTKPTVACCLTLEEYFSEEIICMPFVLDDIKEFLVSKGASVKYKIENKNEQATA